jgi:hypothetical protein
MFNSATTRISALAMSLAGILLLGLLLATPVSSQPTAGGKEGNSILEPTVELSQIAPITVRGDYFAAGVVMRNRGYGTISLNLPLNSQIEKAYLYWAIIRPLNAGYAPVSGKLNGTPITGTIIGTSGTPCWPFEYAEARIDVIRADVTGIAISGSNALTEFPSGLVDSQTPQDFTSSFPLLEGATLVLIFSNPSYDLNTIYLFEGAKSFSNHTVPLSMGSFLPAPSSLTDSHAKTTFVLADGQLRFSGDQLRVNGTSVRGPGSSNDTDDGAQGTDGIGVYPLDGLWDTYSYDISAMIPAGVADTVTPSIFAAQSQGRPTVVSPTSFGGDCLTWIAQILSVKTDLAADIVGDPVCPSSTGSYSLNNTWPDATYTWSILNQQASGASFVGATAPPTTATNVVVQAGTSSFTLQCVIQFGSYSKTVSKTVSIKPVPTTTITGPSSVYQTSTGHVFSSSNTTADTYSWTLTNYSSLASIVGSNTGSSITVDVGPNHCHFVLTLTVTKDGCTYTTTKTVNVLAAPNPPSCSTCTDNLLLANQSISFYEQTYSNGNVHSNGDITIGKSSSYSSCWTSYSYNPSPATHIGNVTAKDDITIYKNNTIQGNVKAGDCLSLFQPVTITGTTAHHQYVSTVSLPSLSYSSFWGPDRYIAQYHSGYSLTPGTYDCVHADNYANLILSTGTYNINTLTLDPHVNLIVNVLNGPVIVNVACRVILSDDIDMTINGGGSLLFTLNTKQSCYPVEFHQCSRILGTWSAPYTEVRFVESNITFKGSICAKSISIEDDNFFVHHSYTGTLPKQAWTESMSKPVITDLGLEQNYPNPFNPSTSIAFALPNDARVVLEVYDIYGRLVNVLLDETRAAGRHSVEWNGRDASGAALPSGTYLYRLTSGTTSLAKRMTLAK